MLHGLMTNADAARQRNVAAAQHSMHAGYKRRSNALPRHILRFLTS